MVYGTTEGRELKAGDKYKVSVGYNLRFKKVFDKAVLIDDKISING